MSVLIFLIVLSVLVMVHEAGHFLVAKLCKVSVKEFGFGFPPRLVKLFRWKETVFTFNLLPFGGFVKMEGEDEIATNPKGSFALKHPAKKLAILFAGIVCNILFAWILISVVLGIGVPLSTSITGDSADAQTMVMDVVPNSPADAAGVVPGTIITGISTPDGVAHSTAPATLHELIAENPNQSITITSPDASYVLVPEYDEKSDTYRVGLATDSIIKTQLGFFKSITTGAVMTVHMTRDVTVGMANLIGGLFAGNVDTSAVTGPVGLVGIVGDAEKSGITPLLILTALISINLAVINLVPFPALDGGRIMITILEWIRGKQFNQKIMGTIYTVGFFTLIAVLILVTIKDVRGLI